LAINRRFANIIPCVITGGGINPSPGLDANDKSVFVYRSAYQAGASRKMKVRNKDDQTRK
jgi:hypothetical protein